MRLKVAQGVYLVSWCGVKLCAGSPFTLQPKKTEAGQNSLIFSKGYKPVLDCLAFGHHSRPPFKPSPSKARPWGPRGWLGCT